MPWVNPEFFTPSEIKDLKSGISSLIQRKHSSREYALKSSFDYVEFSEEEEKFEAELEPLRALSQKLNSLTET